MKRILLFLTAFLLLSINAYSANKQYVSIFPPGHPRIDTSAFVSGTGSSTDNAIPRWDGTTGTWLQGSGIILDDNDLMSWPSDGDGINFPNTTFANQDGIIYKNSIPFIHNFNYGNNGTVTTDGRNIFIGENAGNLTMGSTATVTYESSYNSFVGYQSGYSNTTGYNNSFIGAKAGYSNDTGYYNSFIGVNAGYSNDTGYYNSFIGANAGRSNTTGYYNSFIGANAGYSNDTGHSNSFIGVSAGYSNTTGYSNFFIGRNAGLNNTTGYSNSFIGVSAGRYIADGATPNETANNSFFLGYDSRALADGQTNQIVIGNSAVGLGSNSVVLGNDSITTTALKGNVGIGTTSPDAKLDVVTDIQISGTDDTHGGSITTRFEASVDITAAATATLDLNIPTNYRIEQCYLHVKTALAGGETWDAELNDGGTEEAIVSGAAVAQNTNVPHWADADTWGTLTDAETDIVISKNGGGAFTAQGTIEGWCDAKGFAAWDNE